ncbi:MAG: M15 family metallopeptidase [Gammaproteobacteria bacterium]
MTNEHKRLQVPTPLLLLLFALLPFIVNVHALELPSGFDYADRHIPGLVTDLRYYSAGNFVGQPVKGYHANRAILTSRAIEALAGVQTELKAFGLGIKLYDAYRPQQSVDHFVEWSQDLTATETKQTYYPNVEKSELFNLGYIDKRSGHSRGSTVDLTIVDLETGAELDMGSPFDLFDPISWPDAGGLSAAQRANRLLLSAVMQKHGFKPYPKEWWHFTLVNEPFPDTYFNFPVK